MILHAGDFVITDVVDALEEIAPTFGVLGNMDPFGQSERFPRRRIVEAGGFRIGLTHGDGAPKGLMERVQTHFPAEKLDAIVFGHSHKALNRVHEGILMVNPGSPIDRRFSLRNSLAYLHVGEKLEAEIVYLS